MDASTGADGGSAGAALSNYLRTQATAFLRGIGLRGEDETVADSLLRGSARRIAGVLHTYGELTDAGWAEPMRAELGWLGATLGREPQYTVRLGRLLDALRRLSELTPPEDPAPAAAFPSPAGGAAEAAGRDTLRIPEPGPGPDSMKGTAPGAPTGPAGGDATGSAAARGADRTAGSGFAAAAGGPGRTATSRPAAAGAAVATRGGGGAPAGALAVGAARAAALLERQLTLARTRAHSATLQAMGSARFHALADSIAVLASEVPLTARAAGPATAVLPPLAAQAHARLAEAAGTLPLRRAAHPYNAEAVQASLGADLTADLQDAPWHQVRILLRLSRYAAEVPGAGGHGDPRLAEAALVLQRHHEAAESAAAVSAAARTPRIAPATAYALGVLHADQRHEVEAARFAFSRLWQA
ncbi:CHAD domain-containing protein [Actinacidiphila yanglinensis]|uniref:CHAD domain-containing protein n=1 Tax=Actinacidiphila yanglinensis TaxID=310779 RepID=UPI001F18846D|nr:CHAD domain-containing protein [Actinacidiphila yanglinensis]